MLILNDFLPDFFRLCYIDNGIAEKQEIRIVIIKR
jgi:hypothetical protein